MLHFAKDIIQLIFLKINNIEYEDLKEQELFNKLAKVFL